MLAGVTKSRWTYVSLHHQRTDAFAVLDDGRKCGVAVNGGRLLLVIGETDTPYDLTTMIPHCEVLGLRALDHCVATLTNPILIIKMLPNGRPELRPAPALTNREKQRERMVNTVKIFYEGSEPSLFVGTNGGLFGLLRLRQDEGDAASYYSLTEISFSDFAVNDIDMRCSFSNGVVVVVLVRDCAAISLFHVNLHSNNSAAAVIATLVSEHVHDGMQGFFTYCAISPSGNFVAATADADRLIVICQLSDDALSLTLHWDIRVESAPYRIVPALDDKFICVCKNELLLLEPRSKVVTVLSSCGTNHSFAGISDNSLRTFAACVSPVTLSEETLLHSIVVEQSTSSSSNLGQLATSWLQLFGGSDLDGDLLEQVQRKGVFLCPCNTGGLLSKQCVGFTPRQEWKFASKCRKCLCSCTEGNWVRRCTRCNAQYCSTCLPPLTKPN